MFYSEERADYFKKIIEKLKSCNLVEGVVQLGSGVNGYNDEFSDIDLMVSTYKTENVEAAKQAVLIVLEEFNPVYIKEKQFNKNIYLFIAFMENSLEFNISILPSELLNVKSPLWKVVVDKTGVVSQKMHTENEIFQNHPDKYGVTSDIAFEFVYCALNMDKELRRNNFIYALKMLENMRAYLLLAQAKNENKKLHQFKSYDTLDPSFISTYLSTYPDEIATEKLIAASSRLKGIFMEIIEQSPFITIDQKLFKMLK